MKKKWINRISLSYIVLSFFMDNTIQEDITEINITYIYINQENEIDSVHKNSIHLTETNFISKEKLIYILKQYISENKESSKKYTISSILQYNVDLSNDAIVNEFVNKNYDINELDKIPFLTIIKEIRDIYWKPSLPIFKELNELFIIFYENIEIQNSKSNKSKKITIHQHKKTRRNKINKEKKTQ